VVTVGTVTAQDSWNVDLVGCLPGTIEDTEIEDGYAYCATGSGLLVLDISSSGDPTQVAFLPLYHDAFPSESYVRGITVEGDYAYLVGRRAPMWIIDVSDPTSPFVAGSCDTPEYGFDVVVGNGHAYVSDELDGFHVIDVSDPTAPTQAAIVPFEGRCKGLDLVETTVHLLVELQGLKIVDVTDPDTPVVIGVCNIESNMRHIDVEGKFAYVPLGRSMIIVDIGNPAEPVEVGMFVSDGYDYNYDVATIGDYAYLSNSEPGLRVVDVSEPTAPFEVGTCDIYGSNRRIVVDGNNAYISGGYRGLHVVDIEDPAAPNKTGWYFTLGIVADARIDESFAYVAGGYSCGEPPGAPVEGHRDTQTREGVAGLYVVDVSDPTFPAFSGFGPIYSPTSGSEIEDTYAFVTDGYGGFHVFDVADPALPVEVATLDLGGNAGGVEIVDDIAYVVRSGLTMIDVQDPTVPVEIGVFLQHESSADVAVIDQIAYLTDWYQGLHVVDVSDPTSPKELGFGATPSYALGVAVAGGHAYVAGGNPGLQVFDVSDLTTPTLVGECDTPGHALDVALAGDRAYVADVYYGVRVIDISEPSSPEEVGYFLMTLAPQRVRTHDGHVYVSNGYGGLFILTDESTVGVDGQDAYSIPRTAAGLLQNHPNPFNPQTTIRFDLPATDVVSLTIYDVAGRSVCVLVDREARVAGSHAMSWAGRGAAGQDMPSGTYFCRLDIGGSTATTRMTLIR